jgi:hypothetical protein
MRWLRIRNRHGHEEYPLSDLVEWLEARFDDHADLESQIRPSSSTVE